MERGYRLIRFDNRDAGCSTHFADHPTLDFGALAAMLANGQRPVVPYTLQDMASDVIGLLDALSIEKAHWVGRSMGGMIAQVAASEYPNRVLSLTSIMSSSGNPELPPAKADVMSLMTKRTPHPFDNESGFVAHGLAFARSIAGTGAAFNEAAHRALILEELRRGYNPGGFGRHRGNRRGRRPPAAACRHQGADAGHPWRGRSAVPSRLRQGHGLVHYRIRSWASLRLPTRPPAHRLNR
ncbi:alpha/beta fold hydrolase [Burkholderia ubonensis]|uniref:alpha/beta fold hydrolase n=1 Tax=Burkholderia ubonensis TaxID=101571 RepID=UPI000AF6B091|nr:alpha/beta fold hydrolase [Burkholderia ubonensis]